MFLVKFSFLLACTSAILNGVACNLNIHRAVPGSPAHKRQMHNYNINTKQKHLSDFLHEVHDNEEEILKELSAESPEEEVENENVYWLYAIPASVLVGSTGILPLLVFKSKEGECLKESVSPENLKILLSFAVGGLLGDVFLHLLPEAWMFVAKDGSDQIGHVKVGMWIISGFLCFLFIERIFAEEERMRESTEKIKGAQLSGKPGIPGNVMDKDEAPKVTSTGKTKEKQFLNGFTNNGIGEMRHRMTNTELAFAALDSSEEEDEEEYSEHKIKVIGYLNLLANCTDNFTHGLAVAGSFLVSFPVGVCTTLAILLHEIPHEIGDFAILLNAGFDRWSAAKAQLLTASGALFGCVFGLMAEQAGDSSAWVLPFTSGGFLYIACVTIIPDLNEEKSVTATLKQLVAMFSGVAIMAAVSLIH